MNQPPFRIEIADEQSYRFDSKPVQQVIASILSDHQVCQAEISVAVVDDPTIRSLNNQYLGHDYETDVISFVLDHDPETGVLVGQLIVSTDTAASVAAELETSLQDELLLYVVHGTLHLVGYDDQDDDSRTQMRTAERDYLETLGVIHRGFGSEPMSEGQVE